MKAEYCKIGKDSLYIKITGPKFSALMLHFDYCGRAYIPPKENYMGGKPPITKVLFLNVKMYHYEVKL